MAGCLLICGATKLTPIAEALKATGHKHIVYAGTVGASPGRGYSVGDLFIPTVSNGDAGTFNFKGAAMSIPGAKTGGGVIQVSSPFVETQGWMQHVGEANVAVEIETNHIASIFEGSQHVLAYLLISDVLNSEGETLATAL